MTVMTAINWLPVIIGGYALGGVATFLISLRDAWKFAEAKGETKIPDEKAPPVAMALFWPLVAIIYAAFILYEAAAAITKPAGIKRLEREAEIADLEKETFLSRRFVRTQGGRVIHTVDCQYAQGAISWQWPTEATIDEIEANVKENNLRWCESCGELRRGLS